jgi:hypothetical protein
MEKSKQLIKQLEQIKQLDKDAEWFSELCEQIKAIAIVKTFNAEVEIVEGKWLIGKEIEEALADKTRQDIYGKGINKMIAETIRWSEREIYRCRQFYNKYPYKQFEEAVRKIPAGKLTWHHITNELLSDNPKNKKEHEYISVRIDEKNKALYIKSTYQDFEIRYYD